MIYPIYDFIVAIIKWITTFTKRMPHSLSKPIVGYGYFCQNSEAYANFWQNCHKTWSHDWRTLQSWASYPVPQVPSHITMGVAIVGISKLVISRSPGTSNGCKVTCLKSRTISIKTSKTGLLQLILNNNLWRTIAIFGRYSFESMDSADFYLLPLRFEMYEKALNESEM